ncbi:Carbon-nitrogen hydrolase [Glarea lozoyensis ATCC 20868]|uniref:Carbon-nitrogen hydrolase n=1 Tax=Glarea lozoyensis (strain ATCC 20868 / MF5171) TaxID=1116229 RepID=S3DS84_GLAL2|nr:Carbon-nitrogen hydrolase [Glarea lozoyensis ATCC 20868]EPE34806.1 Carbon-nitrogen hydrolase [Glarea lozoyensis ATCC 20868]
MPPKIRLAISQSHTLPTTALTLTALEHTTRKAQSQAIDLLLFPEAYLGGYPRTATFGASIGARTPEGREQFLSYFKDAVDLGDTPEGAGERWVRRELEGVRGDGTREELERITRETGVFLVVGLVERCAGTLYCGVVYVCPREGCVGKRRKVMPTGSERLIWGQGQPSSLRAVTTIINGTKITLAAAICWENYMPLLRQALYAQNVNLYLAPTADARDAWLALMRTVGAEGRCFVVSANQCVRESNLPAWIRDEDAESSNGKANVNGGTVLPTRLRRMSVTEDGHEIALPETGSRKVRRKSVVTPEGHEIALPDTLHEEDESPETSNPNSSDFICRGGSCIISPFGDVLEGPLWDNDDGLLFTDVDFEDCIRGRLDLDVGGSYSRYAGRFFVDLEPVC